MATDNERLRDRSVREALYVLALSGTYTAEVQRLINSTNVELGSYLRRAIPQLSPLMSRMSNTGFSTVAARVREIRKVGIAKAKEFLRSKAEEMVDTELARTAETLSEISESQVLTVPQSQINATISYGTFDGRNLQQWWKDLSTSDVGRIMVDVRAGVSRGDSTETVVKAVKDSLGLTNQGAETLVRISS